MNDYLNSKTASLSRRETKKLEKMNAVLAKSYNDVKIYDENSKKAETAINDLIKEAESKGYTVSSSARYYPVAYDGVTQTFVKGRDYTVSKGSTHKSTLKDVDDPDLILQIMENPEYRKEYNVTDAEYQKYKKGTLQHSAKGTEWSKHKYIKKVGDRYYYAKEKAKDAIESTRDRVSNAKIVKDHTVGELVNRASNTVVKKGRGMAPDPKIILAADLTKRIIKKKSSNNDRRSAVLTHSAKGTEWGKHKYIAKKAKVIAIQDRNKAYNELEYMKQKYRR